MKTLLALLALAQVSGSVHAPDGSVVAGKIVRAGDRSVTTDKDGAFAISGRPEGVVELEVDSTTVLALPGDLVTITLTKSGDPLPLHSPSEEGEGTIAGHITLDGKPLAHAHVVIGDVRVIANAKGEFLAKGLSQLEYSVAPDARLFPRLRWPRRDAEGTEPFTVDLSKTREASVDLELASQPMIRGRVVDAGGKPVAHAPVLLLYAKRSMLDFPFGPSVAWTMPDGRFSLPPAEWSESEEVEVAVSPPLQSTTRSTPFRLGIDQRELTITLPKLEAVRVRVLDRAGKPVPDALVAFASSTDTTAFESIAHLVEGPLAPRAPRTNGEGEVVLQLATGPYDFAATAEGFLTFTLSSKAITRPMNIDLTLDRAATLRGRVHRGDSGIANATITVLDRSGDRNEFGRSLLHYTEADGRFEIARLVPGPVRINVFKKDELIDRTLDAEAPDDIDVALPPAGTLRGRVIDALTREPMQDFVYTVSPPHAEPNARDMSGTHPAERSTDGTFTMEISAGNYRVSAGALGYTSLEPMDVRVVQEETTNVELPLKRGAVVNGRVTDESGMPVHGATVIIVAVRPERATDEQRSPPVSAVNTESDENGAFTITGIESGPADLTVRQGGYVPYRRTIEAEGTTSLDIRLTRGLSIHGLVTLGGKPVANAQVSATSAAIGGEHQPAVTDDEGRFTLTGLIHARYKVSAVDGERRAEVRDVDPTRQKEVVLVLDPKPRGVVYGTVTGIPPASGGKYTRRTVSVQGNDDSAEGWIDDAGNYRLENAPAGEVSLSVYVETASRTSHTSRPREIVVVAGQPLRVDHDLGGNVRVSGRVTMDERPVANALVWFTNENLATSTVWTRDDGIYEVMLAAAGHHLIQAAAKQLGERHFGTSREIRGGETIDIDLSQQLVEGPVVDAVTRQPIANALVTLAPSSGAVLAVAAEVLTDANGRFAIVTAVAGAYRLIVTAPGYAHRMQLLASATTQYSIELTPTPDLAVRVLDSRTGAALDAYLTISDENSYLPTRPRRVNAGSMFLFSLAPGKYRITAMVQGYETKVVEVTAPGVVDLMME